MSAAARWRAADPYSRRLVIKALAEASPRQPFTPGPVALWLATQAAIDALMDLADEVVAASNENDRGVR